MNRRDRPSLSSCFLVYLGVLSLSPCQPIYEYVRDIGDQEGVTLAVAVLLVAGLQGVMPLAFTALRRVVGRRAVVLDAAIAVLSAFVLARWAQRAIFPASGLAGKQAMISGLCLVAVAVPLVLRRFAAPRELARQALTVVGMLSPILGIMFLWQIAQGAPVIAAAPATVGARPPIVLIVLDELNLESLLAKDGTIDTSSYPNFGALAAESRWFRHATSNYIYTQWSFASFLAGGLVPTASLDLAADPAPNLVSVLRAAGYRVVVASSYFSCRSCRTVAAADVPTLTSLGMVLVRFVDYILPNRFVLAVWPGLRAKVLTRGLRQIETLLAHAEPDTLYILHTLVTHHPYFLDAAGAPYGTGIGPPYVVADGRPQAASDAFLAAMQSQFRFADRWLGRFLAAWRRSGMAERGALVVLADHGSCWTTDCNRADPKYVKFLRPSLIRVPLFVMGPKISPGIDDCDAELMDVFPTVLAAAGLGDLVPPRTSGRNLFATPCVPKPHTLVLGQATLSVDFAALGRQAIVGADAAETAANPPRK